MNNFYTLVYNRDNYPYFNRVGISEINGKNWAAFTLDNSKVPSTYIQSIDKNRNLCCSTFAGLLKIIPQ